MPGLAKEILLTDEMALQNHLQYLDIVRGDHRGFDGLRWPGEQVCAIDSSSSARASHQIRAADG